MSGLSFEDRVLDVLRGNVARDVVERFIETAGIYRVQPGSIDWSAMPPVELEHLQKRDNLISVDYGWLLVASTWAGAGMTLTNMAIMNWRDRLPARAGFTRQYRWVFQYYHKTAVGETAASFTIRSFYDPGTQWTVQIDSPTVTYDWASATPWAASAVLDAYASPSGVWTYLEGRSDWAGAIGSISIREIILEGRYVRS